MEDTYKARLTRREALSVATGLAALGTMATVAVPTSANAEEPTPVSSSAVKPAVAPMGDKIAPYKAACVRTLAKPAHASDGSFLAENLADNVERVARAAEKGADEVGAKLYCFSEFCLQPAPNGASIEQWIEGSITENGPELERLGRAAQKADAFIALSVNEKIEQFPGRYFVSGMLIGPNGNLILNYRKFGSTSIKTRPGDMLTEWLEVFGEESLFPVADTEIGRIAFSVALDVLQPELVRGPVLKGAEIILNPTASVYGQEGPVPTVKSMVRRVRAYENMAYLLLANIGPIPTASVPTTRQPSEIIDFRGNLLSASQDHNEGYTVATLDIDGLRHARTGFGAQNLLGVLQMDVHRLTYDAARFSPSDQFLDEPLQTKQQRDVVLRDTLSGLVERGVLIPPGV